MPEEELSNQCKLAKWTASFATASSLVSLAGMVVFLGNATWGWLWMLCVILLATCTGGVVFLGKIKCATDDRRQVIWLSTSVYFAGIIVIVALTLESFGVALVLAVPEVAGLILSLAGWVHCRNCILVRDNHTI